MVFSQWTRTHDVVIRRLAARGIGYVSFHGGIPSEKRPELVQRFRDDPACRVFLSTDAGSTGLNLQHASILVNMDLPWNPAVLEQRIARVHRLGQARPVQIVNFVAKGTIEEGMLSVLAFKRSLAEGILDGGSNEISLGGSRLTRFMKDVDSVTGSMGSGEAVATAEETGAADGAGDASSPSEAARETLMSQAAEQSAVEARDAGSDPWQALVQMGAQFIGAVAASGSPSHRWIERDPSNGSQSLRVPLPSPEIADRLADALSALAQALRGGTA
ncbi:helicase-related protein [Bradyrhizobium sp. WSM1743]|uniref:helicase-related protein n=1 Tax=Bradyrhizobium sp. WSM1743 TaxID=318996 RepID=UPI001FD8BFB6|nr:C-terminal helicase domain-containing protein [Bradyrhizobium sp. WSM1743]